MTITFIGHGYVGLVTACVFADLGNTVYVVGRTPEKLKRLSSGDPIIFEPTLEELLKKNLDAKRIIFTDDFAEAIPQSEVVFIAVGTPPKENGEADLSEVLKVAENIGKNLKQLYTVVSCKSTVPIGTNRKIKELIKGVIANGLDFDVASCPEFLREGTAVNDTFHPDRIIIGSDSQQAIDRLLELHEPLDGERVVVGLESAEIIKYASNSLLSTKISFANLIAFICEKSGANVEDVLKGVGLDKRLGREFLYAGIGYGGSCFPKDVKALIQIGKHLGINMGLLENVDQINYLARDDFYEKIKRNAPGKKIAVWGIAFKPNTDDIRFAPSIDIINHLLDDGFSVTAYDPEAMENAKKVLGNRVIFASSAFEAVEGADALVVCTEWNEFKDIDLGKVKQLLASPALFDGRNMYEKDEVKKLGFTTYISVGR